MAQDGEGAYLVLRHVWHHLDDCSHLPALNVLLSMFLVRPHIRQHLHTSRTGLRD